MKKLLLCMLAIVAMVATSCQQDTDLGVKGGEIVSVSFNLGTQVSRAYSDGSQATHLQWAVYKKNGDLLENLENLVGQDTEYTGSKTVSLDLATGDTYSVIFWAAAPNAPYRVDFENKTMTVNYDGALSNAENRDAFYAYKSFTVNGPMALDVELKRPFAQLNIGANDFTAMENAGRKIELSKVIVPVYTTLNLVEGTVDGQATKTTFDYAALPTEAFVVNGYQYLAMNYILVAAEQEVVDVEFHYATAGESWTNSRTVGSVPVKRNHRTNLYGAILTSNVNVNVEIKPEYDGDNDNKHGYYVEEGTIYINSAEGLKLFAEKVNNRDAEWSNANVVLACDIDLATTATRNTANWTPIGLSTNLSAGDTFRGTFDGKGYSIKNMICEGTEIAGLFGYLYAATIKNVTLENATISSKHYAGGIAAWVLNTRGNIQRPIVIENCHVVGSTIASTPELVNGEWDNGDKVGGLVGYACFADAKYAANEGAKIANCSVENTTVKAYRDFGGLVGYAMQVALEQCTTNNVTIEQDLTHDYKNPTPTTYGYTIGRNEGGNTVDGNPYLTDGVTTDEQGNYCIYNAAGLKWLANEVNKYSNYEYPFKDKTIYLTQNVDLNGVEWTPIGDYRFSANRFCGTFDGKGHTISNFKITKKTDKSDSNKSSYGFFGNVEGTIKNLTIANATVSSYAYTGALAGRLNSGLIENCHVVNCVVSNTYWQGGILLGQVNGEGNTPVVRNCSIKNSSITSKSAIGAITGPVTTTKEGAATFENCVVENCQVIQQGSFGASYDKLFGTMFGYLETDATSSINVNNCTAVNTTVKGESNAMFAGDIDGNIYINGALPVATTEELVAAIKAGGNYILVNDIAMTEATYQNIDFTLDGNGHTISQAEGSTNTYALFDSVTGKITLKNVTFAGIKGGAVLRSIGAEATIENVTIEGAETTQQQGLLRLVGKNVVKNSTFKNNTCSMVMTLNFDGANNDPQLIEDCVFEGNTCNGTAVVYYVKGAGATINGNSFIGNTVNCSSNGATVYMGFQENCVVKNNLFKNNTVNEASTSSRVAGGIFFGYEMEFTGNAFIGNQVTGTNAKAKDVCVSTYYTNIDLSGNYWGGNAPVEDENYFVQHKDRGYNVTINDYLTTWAE